MISEIRRRVVGQNLATIAALRKLSDIAHEYDVREQIRALEGEQVAQSRLLDILDGIGFTYVYEDIVKIMCELVRTRWGREVLIMLFHDYTQIPVLHKVIMTFIDLAKSELQEVIDFCGAMHADVFDEDEYCKYCQKIRSFIGHIFRHAMLKESSRQIPLRICQISPTLIWNVVYCSKKEEHVLSIFYDILNHLHPGVILRILAPQTMKKLTPLDRPTARLLFIAVQIRAAAYTLARSQYMKYMLIDQFIIYEICR